MTPYLTVAAFISGVVSLGLELAASRLLEPFFGTSNLIWSAVIGMILLYLAIGYSLGGRWADRSPQPATLALLLTLAGASSAAIPFVARPVLNWGAHGFLAWNLGQLAAGFLVMLLFFSLPVTLLGCVSPFVVRLSLSDVQGAGGVAGKVSTIATAGSFIGANLPTLVLIPTVGARRTFVLLGLFALLTGLWGLWRYARPRFWACCWLLPVLLALLALPTPTIKPVEGLIYERESLYTFIQVVRQPDGQLHLLLNEGQGIHSVTVPEGEPLTGGVWDYFLAAPLFNPPSAGHPAAPRTLLVIGLAAGTVTTQYTALYGPIPMDGVELDGEIARVGREYFGMTQPHLRVHIGDGRTFVRRALAQPQPPRYDAVIVDAYRLPYIPWHLTTVEFFAAVRACQSATGTLAINVGRTPEDWRLVEALLTTLRQVYPSVHVIAVPNSLNAVIVATAQPTTAENLRANARMLGASPLAEVARRAHNHLRPTAPGDLIFTDDRAPLEQLTNDLILRYFMGIP